MKGGGQCNNVGEYSPNTLEQCDRRLTLMTENEKWESENEHGSS